MKHNKIKMVFLSQPKLLLMLCLFLPFGGFSLAQEPVNEKPVAIAADSAIKTALNKPNKINPADSLLPMLGGLLAILALIFILAAILKRFSGFNMAASNIKIIDRQSLGAKEKLVIIQVQEKQYLLGVTPQQINQICEIEQPLTSSSSGKTFEQVMKQFLNPAQKNKAEKITHNKPSDTGGLNARNES